MIDNRLRNEAFQIAYSVLERSGELGESTATFLLGKIDSMMSRGEMRRLRLSNAAIDAYRLRYKVLTLVT